MRIIHVIDSEGMYGAEVMLLNLAEEQMRSGHRPVIASIRERDEIDTPLEDEARRRGLEAVTFRMADGPNFAGAWDILRYARLESFDVMHTHGYKGDILFGFIPVRLRKIPLICTLHGWTSMRKLSKLGAYEYLDALSMRHFDAVCVVSEAMLGHPRLKTLNGRGRIHFVPNGIPPQPEPACPPDDEIADFCRQGPTIVSIGRLSEEKGHRYLVEAFARLVKSIPDARLLIVGEGPERGDLESLARSRGLDGRFLLPGYRDQAWRYLTFCTAFVLPSLTEGLPITLLEAMRAGVPVVSTAVGGIPGLLGNGEAGFLVEQQCPEAICRGVMELMRDPGVAGAIARRAADRVRNDYSSARMAERYLELYRTLPCREH